MITEVPTGPGYCKVAVSPVRAQASDAAEMVTQLLFGEPLTILESDRQWLKVCSYMDNYEGWVDGKHIVRLTDKELKRWLDGLSNEHSLIRTIATPWGNQRITRGAFVPESDETAFQIGKDHYRFSDSGMAAPETAAEMALDYVMTPYLWGGKTPFGIDCSGLMQTVHRLFGINLPRDAYQQEEHGQEVPFEDRQPGDLVFFKNPAGRIHHVGLLINPSEVIHASGWVRVDDLTREGIVRRTDGELSHVFYSIKRL